MRQPARSQREPEHAGQSICPFTVGFIEIADTQEWNRVGVQLPDLGVFRKQGQSPSESRRRSAS